MRRVVVTGLGIVSSIGNTAGYKGKEAPIQLRASPADDARLVATIEPGAMGRIEACDGTWCEMRFDRYKGWVQQSLIWGAYPHETFED